MCFLIAGDVEAIFSEHDKDEDGFLDFKEYLKVQKTHPDINREKANRRREL